jgi:hypothetical protein
LMAKQALDRPASAEAIWNGLDMLAKKAGYKTQATLL